jgi:hypothetical protein
MWAILNSDKYKKFNENQDKEAEWVQKIEVL